MLHAFREPLAARRREQVVKRIGVIFPIAATAGGPMPDTAASSRQMVEILHGLPRQQQTLAQPVHVDGFGFWSGQDVTLEFRPAAPGTGIVFVRHDIGPNARIPASVHCRVDSPRRTTLAHQDVHVEMVEHVLAALAGLQIDNCEIWSDRAEMPGVDGSSLPFAVAMQSAGSVAQGIKRPYLVVQRPLRMGDADSWVEARPATDGAMTLQYHLDYGPDHAIREDTFRMTVNSSCFVEQLAPARTFLTREEAEWLRAKGLAQRVTTRDVLVFDKHGVVDNSLRMDNECAAHKVLDMVGDLSLAGCDLVGNFSAYRSGHRLNARMVKALLSEFQVVDQWKATA